MTAPELKRTRLRYDVPMPVVAAPQPSGAVLAEAARVLAKLDDAARVAQTSQVLQGWDLIERRGHEYVLSDWGRRIIRDGPGVGSVYGLFRADPWSGRDWETGVVPEARADVAAMIQAEICAASHGIPALIVEEAAHGLQVLGGQVLPTLLGQASTWNLDLIMQGAALVSQTARADGINVVLSSGLDLLRDPRWGRSEECPGESPRLGADVARALVLGFQGAPDGSELRTRAGVVMKHVAGQGDYLGGRNSGSASIGLREVAEVHLVPVAAAVEAGALGLMAAYNDIDGVPCIANSWLLDEVLRGMWNWDGVVMADALAIDRLAEAMVPEQAAAAALRSGVDMNMGDGCWATLHDTVADHRDVIKTAAARVLRAKSRLGLLGEEEAGCHHPDPRGLPQVSQQMARESITLLKGDLAPLAPDSRIVVTGEYSDDPLVMLGDYVSPPASGDDASLATALTDRLRATFVRMNDPDYGGRLAKADVVILQVGGTSVRPYDGSFRDTGASTVTTATCGEGVDVADLALPHGQDDLIHRVRQTTRGRLIIVAVMGRPHVLTLAATCADDLLLAWYPGPYGGETIAAMLAGDLAPSGRLPVTMPSSPGVVPWRDDDRVGRLEPAYVGLERADLYPFGGGYGFHTARLVDARLERTASGGAVVDVTLCADRIGEDVVCVFARALGAPVWPRRRQLVGHTRIQLGPAPQRLRFDLGRDELFGLDGTYCVLSIPLVGVSFEFAHDDMRAQVIDV